MATLANQNNKDETKTEISGGAVTQPGAGAPAYIGNAAQTQNKPASSGRFVNTQAFMNANKGAGQQIGGAIQSGINRQLNQEKDSTIKEADNVRAGIQSAQGNVQQGGQLLGNVGGNAQAFGINNAQKLNNDQMMAMANDANQLKQFTDYRTGNIAEQDTSNLNNLNQSYQDRAAAANAALQSRQQQLANEANRFGLLQEFVGQKNNYGQGAQRLDQVFLQKDKSGALNNLNKNLIERKAGDFADLTNASTGLRADSGVVTNQASALAKELQNQTLKNETGYINEVGQRVDSVNAERDALRQKYNDFLGIMKGSQQGTIDQNVFNDFALQNGMNVYNTFDNIGNIKDIADINDQQAKDYKNVANQKDVDIYSGLSKLAGIGNDKLNQQVYETGKLGEAAKAKDINDQNSLMNRIINQYNTMLGTAKDTNLGAAGSAQYYAGTDWLGRSKWGDTTQYANANMGDVLKAGGVDINSPLLNISRPAATSELTKGEQNLYETQINPTSGMNYLNPINQFNLVKDVGTDAMNRSGQAMDDTIKDYANVYNNPKKIDPATLLTLANPGMAFTNNAATDLGRDAGGSLRRALGMGDAVGGAEGTAKTKAFENLSRMITDWQKQQGLGKVASLTGVQDKNDLNMSTNTFGVR